MTGLEQMVADYLRVRRCLGYKLDGAEHILTRFVDYVQASNPPHTVTVAHALAFATAPPGASPRWQALRLSAIRFSRGGHTRPIPRSRCRRRGCCRPDPPGPRPTSTPTPRSRPCWTRRPGCARRSGQPPLTR